MKCSNCGSRVNPEDRFCSSCGAGIGDQTMEESFVDFDRIDNDLDQVNFDYRTPYEDLYKDDPETKSSAAKGSFFGAFGGGKKKKGPKVREKPVKDDPKPIEFTSELPLISEEEDSMGSRRVLSEEKKRIFEESREKALNNENFVINEPSSEEDLMQTQKINLADLQKIETEIRKVRTKESEQNQAKASEKSLNKKDLDAKLRPGNKNQGLKKKAKTKKVEKEVRPKERRPKSPILPMVSALAVFMVVLGFFVTSKTGKAAVVDKFEKAYYEQEALALEDLVYRSDGQGINDDEAQGLMKLMEADPIFRSSIMGAIKEDSIKMAKDGSYRSTRPYRLDEVGKKFVFFKDYKVVLDPIKISLSGGAETAYSFAGSEHKGPVEDMVICPGLYDLAIGDKVYPINVSNTNEAYVDGRVNIDLANPVAMVGAPSEEPKQAEESEETEKAKVKGDVKLTLNSPLDAEVFINGQSTGMTVEKFNGMEGVALKEGDKIQVKETFPWGPAMSEEYLYAGEEAIYLEARYASSETRQVIIDRVVQVLREDEEARKTMSMDPYTTIIEPELTDAKILIDSEINGNVIFYRDYKTMAFDPASLEVYANGDGSFTGYIGGVLSFDSAEASPDNMDNMDLVQTEDIRGFHLTYLPDQGWMVNMWGFTERYIDTSNLIGVDI